MQTPLFQMELEDATMKLDLFKVAPRVLIVEDDIELSTVFDHVLRTIHPGIVSDWVTSVEQAISYLKTKAARLHRTPYDLILADIWLEGESTGLDLWKLVQEELPDLPIVVTSAMPIDRFFAKVGRGTISPPFLAKPFNPGDCRQLLEGLLRPRLRMRARAIESEAGKEIL